MHCAINAKEVRLADYLKVFIVFASQAPSKLPPLLIARHLFLACLYLFRHSLRFILVCFVWIALLPYTILWIWRGFFHVALSWGQAWTSVIQDSDWSRMTLSALVLKSPPPWSIHNTPAVGPPNVQAVRTVFDVSNVVQSISDSMNKTFGQGSITPRIASLETTYTDLLKIWDGVSIGQRPPQSPAKVSFLGKYGISHWLPVQIRLYGWNSTLVQECFHGQIIVCSVIVVFVTAFLLREWVMANQPLGELPNAEAALPPAQQPEQQHPAARPPPYEMVQNEEPSPLQVRAANADETSPFTFAPPESSEHENHLFTADGFDSRPQQLAERLNSQEDRRLLHQSSFPSHSLAIEVPRHDRSSSAHESTLEEANNISVSLPEGHKAGSGAQAFLDRQRQREDGLRDHQQALWLNHEQGAEGKEAQLTTGSSDTSVNEGNLVVPGLAMEETRVEQHTAEDGLDDDNPSEASSYDDDDSDISDHNHDHPAVPAGGAVARRNAIRGGPRPGIAPEDLAAIDAVENEDDLFFEADLEGILEAVGMQGPLLSLLQNASLMILLIAVLLAMTIWLPLMLGKTVVATNALKAVFVPVNIVRLGTDPIADFVIDLVHHFRYHSLQGFRQRLLRDRIYERKPDPKIPVGLLIYRWTRDHIKLFKIKQETPPSSSFSSVAVYTETVKSQSAKYRDSLYFIFKETTSSARLRWQTLASHDTDLDRILCITIGYTIVIAGAALYLKYTQNVQARNATRVVRDALNQQFVLCKVRIDCSHPNPESKADIR